LKGYSIKEDLQALDEFKRAEPKLTKTITAYAEHYSFRQTNQYVIFKGAYTQGALCAGEFLTWQIARDDVQFIGDKTYCRRTSFIYYRVVYVTAE
jgi:hypothetical protein